MFTLQQQKNCNTWALPLFLQPPFYSQDVQQMYFKIMHAKLETPDTLDENTRSILNSLLDRDPGKRLADAAAIKAHPYFKGVNWEKLLKKEVPPPFIPPVVNDSHNNTTTTKKRMNELTSPSRKTRWMLVWWTLPSPARGLQSLKGLMLGPLDRITRKNSKGSHLFLKMKFQKKCNEGCGLSSALSSLCLGCCV